MKSILLSSRIFMMIVFTLFYACTKESSDKISLSPPNQTIQKSDSIIPLGCIRGYFGDEYKSFTDHIEKVAAIDSFSNCYYYGYCNNTLKQITLIRCDSTYVIALYIMGISPESLPVEPPVPDYCKYAEIQFYKFQDWNSVSNGHYSLDNFYGRNVFITNSKDDVLTGTFEGDLISPDSSRIHVSKGEFNIKVFRKYMPCGKSNGK
jgi:hypothetical protein